MMSYRTSQPLPVDRFLISIALFFRLADYGRHKPTKFNEHAPAWRHSAQSLFRTFCFCLGLLSFLTPEASAAVFTVTRTNSTGAGSLPVIIAEANATPGDHTIEFGVSGAIVLLSPLPLITNNLNLNGRNSGVIVKGQRRFPLISFAEGTTNILKGLTFSDGYRQEGNGGAISNAGTLFIEDCRFTNHTALNGAGGGIYSSGAVGVMNSAFEGCTSESGGAIACSSNLTVVSSAFTGNQAVTSGGAIFSECSVCQLLTSSFDTNSAGSNGGAVVLKEGTNSVFQCSFMGNRANTNGGALYVDAPVILTKPVIIGNRASSGGGIYSSERLSILEGTIMNNRAAILGGGVFGVGELEISATSLAGNVAGGQQASSAGIGGGLFIEDGIVRAINSTFSGNSAKGSMGRDPINSLVNGNGGGSSCVRCPAAALGQGGVHGAGGIYGSKNHNGWPGQNGGFGGGGGGGGGGASGWPQSQGGSGGRGGRWAGDGGPGMPSGRSGAGGGGAGLGGAIAILGGSIDLLNCTIYSNSASGGAGGFPDGESGRGIAGGVYCEERASVALKNTIVAGNSAPGFGPEVYGHFVSHGFNLIEKPGEGSGFGIYDYQNEHADLGPLQDNGGPTLTHALLQDSIAIGGGTSDGAPATDQRGMPRPPGRIDIGAFQLNTLITPAISWDKPGDIVFGTPLSSAQLNAQTGAKGKLTYTPSVGAVLSAGPDQMLGVVFTPDDPAQYTATTGSVVITVLKADQAITFAPLQNKQIGDPPFILSASSSAILPVTFTLKSGPAELFGNVLSLGTTDGWITVVATQAGNSNYNAAPEAERSFHLGRFPVPEITVQPADQIVYPGDRVTFAIEAINEPLTYQWQFRSEDLPGATAQSLVLAGVQAPQEGPYRVIVTNPAGSVTSSTATLSIMVSEGTPRIIQEPEGLSVRSGESATLSVTATGGESLQYQWYTGETGNVSSPIAGATNSTYTALNVAGDTTFWVAVSNSFGTADSASAKVEVLPPNTVKLDLRMLSGMPALRIEGLPGASCTIERAVDAASGPWTNLIELTLPVSPFTFIDPNPSTSRGFYRAIAQ